MEMNINDNLKTDKLKTLEQEKLSSLSKQENLGSNFKKDYELKISKLNDEMAKLQYDIKVKDQQMLSNDTNNDKMSGFTKQKVRYLITIG